MRVLRVDSQRAAVGTDLDLSIKICSRNLSANRLVAFEYVRHRMPVGVGAAAADQDQLWPNGVDERRGARGAAAMVRRLQDDDRQQIECRQQRLLDVLADVAR